MPFESTGARTRPQVWLACSAVGLLMLSSVASGQTCMVTTPIGAGLDLGTSVAIQSDGKILVAGYRFGASDDFAVVRYNRDFTLDASFGTGGKVTTLFSSGEDRAEAMALQSDGKIVVVGHKNSGAGNNDLALARYDLDGSLDTTFNPGGLLGGAPNLAGMVVTAITGAHDELEAVAIQPDGKIVVAGFAGFSVAGTKNALLARYNANGSLDTAGFNAPNGYLISATPLDDAATAAAIQPGDGKILMGGWSDNGSNLDFTLARFNTDGSTDGGFASVTLNFPFNDDDRVNALIVQPDGKIVIAGEVRNSGWSTFGAARRNADGSPDGGFGTGGLATTAFTGGHDVPYGMVLQSDLSIVLGGYSNWFGAGTSADFALLRWDSTGALDNAFDIDGKVTTDVSGDNDWIDSLAIQPDGKIVAAGYSRTGANDDFALVRYKTDGSLDDTCVTLSYRSIGVNGAVLENTGTASVTAGTNVVTFAAGASLPPHTAVGAVGRGDVLTLDPGGPNQESFHILSLVSPTKVVTQLGAMAGHSGESYEIRRAFTALQDWEDARDGNLVALNRREIAVLYKDGPFVPPFAPSNAALLIGGSTTDASRFMSLVAEDGQRHDGTEGSGVLIDGQASTKFGILNQDDYTRVDGLELVRFRTAGDNGYASIVTEGVGAIYERLLVHDFFISGSTGDGVRVSATAGGWSFTLRNSILYDGDRSGVRLDEATSTILVENCTILDMETSGVTIGGGGGTATVTNTLSMNHGSSAFDAGSGTLVQSYNISSDGTAGGTGSMTFRTATDVPTAAANFVVFNDLTPGSEDFHLQVSTVNDAADNANDLSTKFLADVDGSQRAAPWDIGAHDLAGVTAVTLSSFETRGLDGAVAIEWETSSELDNLGFLVFRSGSEAGGFEPITSRAIPGLGSSPVGARYTLEDTDVVNGRTYYYKLQDIETTGRTTLHGPVAATPSGTAAARSEDPDPGSERSRITYGTPAANALRILSRSRDHLTVELRTEGFYATPQPDGTVRITVPDFVELAPADALAVPVRRSWLDAVAGRQVEILSIEVRRVEGFTGLVPSHTESTELVARTDGTLRTRRRPRRPSRLPVRLYPDASARLVTTGFQGEIKKALLELAPLRWDPVRGRLLLTKQMQVRLSFQKAEPDEVPAGRMRRGHLDRRARRGRAGSSVVAHFETTSRGLYAISYQDIFRRRRAISVGALRLSRQGEPVAFHVEPDGPGFDPGSTLYFFGEGPAANPYGDKAVYQLEFGRRGRVMEQAAATASGTAPGTSSFWRTITREENHLYQAGLVEAPDRWLWDSLFAPETKGYPFDVGHLAPGGEPARLTVWLQGTSDLAPNPDHHLRLYLNGAFVGESRWNGKLEETIRVGLANAVPQDGENLLQIESVGDTEAAYSTVLLNRFQLQYPGSSVAESGVLEGEWSESGNVEVWGLDERASILDLTESQPRWLHGANPTPEGSLRFRVEAGRRYAAFDAAAVQKPQVVRPKPRRLESTGNRADYLIIGPAGFLPAMEPLLRLRTSQGLRARTVSTEQIFQEFGFGESTPEAIQEFIGYAFHHWRSPAPRYVLLVGDATYDPKDFLQTGVVTQVPSLEVKTSHLWTVSDPMLAAVNGDDVLPDLAIGRLPAVSVEEAASLARKIVDWETTGRTLGGSAMLVTDNPDAAGDFDRDARELASGILDSRSTRLIMLSELGPGKTRQSIATIFDEGASLVSYLGHGGINLWASENLLDRHQIGGLKPQPQQPLVITMNCLNGYFQFPYFDSLAESMLKAQGKGAIAAFSPSGLSINRAAHRYHQALLAELIHGGHERLGDAILAAQRTYAETGASPELLTIYHLFGDPALEIQ